MESVPPGLKQALDLAKRFNLDLSTKLTPEQRRDFGRMLQLIEDACKQCTMTIPYQAQRASTARPIHGF